MPTEPTVESCRIRCHGSTKSERNQKIAEMRSQGKTLDEIADRFGITRERVRQVLTKHYPEYNGTHIGMSRKEARDKIIAALSIDTKMTVRELADQFDVVPRTIHRAIREQGGIVHKRQRKAKHYDTICQMLEDGHYPMEIARHIGIKVPSIYAVMKKYNLKSRVDGRRSERRFSTTSNVVE